MRHVTWAHELGMVTSQAYTHTHTQCAKAGEYYNTGHGHGMKQSRL